MTEDGQHLAPADPALYYGLPADPNSRALGKKGTMEELGAFTEAFHRGDLGPPSFLTEELRYPVRFNKVSPSMQNCGCYHYALQPDPRAAVVIESLQL